MLKKLHHVAYRCRDAAETTQFYVELLGLKLVASLVQDRVPSLARDDPHNHIFFEMEDGSYIAFFDVLADHGPFASAQHAWAQHLALEVGSVEQAQRLTTRLRERGVEVIGPVDHHFCVSWYFHDPSGHRLELAVRADDAQLWRALTDSAPGELRGWNARKEGR
jgi:catechol 2,3-dioxygenase-like lactoylglutathione lyase family enzyme